MRINTLSAATLLTAGAIAVGIAAAPAATAAVPGPVPAACISATPGTECVTPGNAQINDSLPPDFASQYPYFVEYGFDRLVGGHR